MKKRIQVSVVMTYYNGSRFVKDLLLSLSVQQQYFDELLIMDDCSSQEETTFLKKEINEIGLMAKTHYIKNKKNLGYARNFYRGLEEAKGHVLFLCDQDDIWNVNKIKEMTTVMHQHPQLNLLCCDIKPIYSDPNAPRWDSKNLKEMVNDGSIEICSDIRRNHHLRRSGCTMCVKKDFYMSIAQYWIDEWAHDDYLWKFAVYSHSCAIYHRELHLRRLHADNTSELKIRTRTWRIEELNLMLNQHKSLEKWINTEGHDEMLIVMVRHNIQALRYRIKFLQSRNPFLGFYVLFKYFDTYPRGWKGALMDIYLTYIGTHQIK